MSLCGWSARKPFPLFLLFLLLFIVVTGEALPIRTWGKGRREKTLQNADSERETGCPDGKGVKGRVGRREGVRDRKLSPPPSNMEEKFVPFACTANFHSLSLSLPSV